MRRRGTRLFRSTRFLLGLVLVSLVLVTMLYQEYPVFQRSISLLSIVSPGPSTQSKSSKATTLQKPVVISKPLANTRSKVAKLANGGCSKVNHVGFLKIHKSGSTTITNILQRYGMKNDLNVVLPNKKEGVYGFNYLGHGRNFTMKSVIPIPKDEHYHILCNHVVYNRTMFRKLLPNGTFYLAIVREPEDRFVSAAFYYGLVKNMKSKIPGVNSTQYLFSKWLQNPWKYGVSMETYNHVAYDFGLDQKYFTHPGYIENYIKTLDADFHLVLLMDYFDESLILLRRSLCWSIKDVIYLKRNSGTYKSNTMYALSEVDRKLLKKWHMADRLVFEHFRSRFWRQAEGEGHGLFLETAFFKEVLRRVSDYCTHGTNRWPSIDIEPSEWSDVMTVTKYDCQFMEMSDITFLKKLQKKAWRKYNASIASTVTRLSASTVTRRSTTKRLSEEQSY